MSLPVKAIVLTIAGQGGVDGHRFKYSSCSTSNKMSLPVKANFIIFFLLLNLEWKDVGLEYSSYSISNRIGLREVLTGYR